METTSTGPTTDQAFTLFVKEVEPRLSYGLAAAYGPEVGADVTADALGWAWEHWDETQGLANPSGYLYRVAQSRARWYHRPRILFSQLPKDEGHDPAPELGDALAGLTKNQRVSVVLIHGLGYSEREVAELLHLSRWSVRTHAERGLKRLRSSLGATVHV